MPLEKEQASMLTIASSPWHAAIAMCPESKSHIMSFQSLALNPNEAKVELFTELVATADVAFDAATYVHL